MTGPDDTRADTYRNPEQSLWASVLLSAISEAVNGARDLNIRREHWPELTRRARAFFDRKRDLEMVCELAGVDPIAIRERVKKMIAAAPSPEELAAAKRQPDLIPGLPCKGARGPRRGHRRQKPRAGVVSDFAASEGTGGGTRAQDSSKMAFHAHDMKEAGR